MEKSVLFAKGLDIRAGVCFFSLEGHVGVGDLRDGTEIENYGQKEDKDSDCQVDPLDVLQCFYIFAGVQEEDVAAQDWGNDCADTVESLSEVDAQLGIAGRAAHCE